MVVLRATRKVLRLLPLSNEAPPESDTALGDWYVNRLVVDRRPLLLLMSSESLLSILVPARDTRTLPNRLAGLVGARLRRLDLPEGIVDAEMAAMEPVVTSSATSRSVLGSMVDFAFAVPHCLRPGWDESALPHVEDQLAGTPCRASTRYSLYPYQRAPELLLSLWSASGL